MLNGLPAIVGFDPLADPTRQVPRFVLMCSIDAAGNIANLYSVLNDDKLSHITFPS